MSEMSIEQVLGQCFKSEVKTSGRKLIVQEKIFVSSASDTDIHAYVRGTSSFHVRLSSKDIGSESFSAECNCPVAKRGQFCKHIWATLLCVGEKYPDFLNAKQEIHRANIEHAPTERLFANRVSQPSRSETKLRAAEYRKLAYQINKERLKGFKQKRAQLEKEARAQSSRSGVASLTAKLPAKVEEALAYFSKNGFPMPEGPDKMIVSEAKRKLSRVFHPDKGGSTDEIIELNHYCELLLRFLQV
jgi:uncharacterized Zn finger protein